MIAPLDFNEGIRERHGLCFRVGSALRFTLIKHDFAIGIAALRQLMSRTGDMIAVLVIIPLLAIIARGWSGELSTSHREIIAFGVSALMTFALAKGLLERVRFHQTEGVLAHFAQRSDEWLSYALPLFIAGLFLHVTGMAVVNILHPFYMALGILSGVVVGLSIPFLREPVVRWWRNIAQNRRRILHRHQHALFFGAGGSALIGVICVFLPEKNDVDAFVTVGYGVAVALLTGQVNVAIVRYLTLVRPSAMSLLHYWLPIQLALLLPFAAILFVSQSWVAAGLAALFSLGLPAITALRIFAYRAFNRLIADWVVSILIVFAGYAAFIFPPLGPAVIISGIIWLARRGSRSEWLLT